MQIIVFYCLFFLFCSVCFFIARTYAFADISNNETLLNRSSLWTHQATITTIKDETSVDKRKVQAYLSIFPEVKSNKIQDRRNSSLPLSITEVFTIRLQ